MAGIFVTDLRHCLDSDGKVVAGLPSVAKQFASFLVLIVDGVMQKGLEEFGEVGIRCRTKKCRGSVLARIDSTSEEILWKCPVCGQRGVIRNWQGTSWDQREPGT
jgi:hypothetical protein